MSDEARSEDIVERLRNYAIPTDEDYSIHPGVCLEGADEIERLRKRLAEYGETP